MQAEVEIRSQPIAEVERRRSRLLTGTVAAAIFTIALVQGGIPAEATASAAVIVWWAVLVGVLVGALDLDPRRLPAPALVALGGLAAVAALTAASLAWGVDDGRAFVDAVQVALYLGVFALLIGTLQRGDGRAVLTGLAIGLVAVGVLALGSRLVPSLLTGDTTRLREFPGAGGRLGYPIAYWNGLAVLMSTGIVLLAWLGASAERARLRALALMPIPALALVIYFTGSRGGVLALLVGVAAAAALTPARPRLVAGFLLAAAAAAPLILAASQSTQLVEGAADSKAKLAGGLLLLATIVAGAVVAWFRVRWDERFAALRVSRRVARLAGLAAAVALLAAAIVSDVSDRVDSLADPAVEAEVGSGVTGRFLAPESNGRVQLWGAAIDAFADQPLKGVGAAGYSIWWNQNGSLDVPTRHAHSVFLESFAELGLFGGLAVLAFFGTGIAGAWTRTFGDLDGTVAAAAGVLAAGTIAAATEWTADIPAAFAPVLIAVAVLAGRATLRDHPRKPASAAMPGSLRLALGGLAVVALLGSGLLLLSEKALNRSEELAATGDYRAAAEAASEASALLPFAAGPWIQLGQVQQLAGDLDGSRASIAEGLERAEEDPTYAFLLANIDRYRDDPIWRAEIVTAFELSPYETPPGSEPGDSLPELETPAPGDP